MFNNNAFFDACAQVTRQVSLELIAGIDDKTGVNVAPKLFQIRIHPGKKGWPSCLLPLGGATRIIAPL
jgi:hypothetical protein